MTDTKLRENEVIHCPTFELACLVCEKAADLGLGWSDDDEYEHVVGWSRNTEDSCYDINRGKIGSLRQYTTQVVITAEEWLNRHDIFRYGQKVEVRDDYSLEWRPRIYIASDVCVAKETEKGFEEGRGFSACSWEFIRSVYPPYEDTVKVMVGEQTFTVSESKAKCLKEMLK